MPLPFDTLVNEARARLASRFTIERELGRGGQGVVVHAQRTALLDGTPTRDEVALKFYYDPQQDERVAREIALMTRLRHACLANLLEHGTFDIGGDVVRFLAWEYIDGDPLSEILSHQALSPKAVAVLGRDIARAITEIWTEHVVHRDVKPGNIMLRGGGTSAVLIDLGCARHLDHSTLTVVGGRVGTRGYMSPEQAFAEHQLTCFSDVFSLGIVLTESLTGRHPTGFAQDVIATHRILASTHAPLAPAALVHLIDRMLHPRPAHRPAPDRLADAFDQLAVTL